MRFRVGSALNVQHAVIKPVRRTRLIRHDVVVSLTVMLTAFFAYWTAALWPIQDNRIQASFFISLASSSLTLFGLVFTLCLIGTQLIATRTNVTVNRIFSVITWLYLILFLVTTLWTLVISYHAGNADASLGLCERFILGRKCISEARAGRWSIFGLSWSFLLLLPFIYYVYRRLTPRHTFSALVGATLRARNEKSLKRCCRRLGDEVISGAADSRAVAEGLSQLLEFGAIRTRRKRRHGSLTANDVARCVTDELIHLNNWLSNDIRASTQVLIEFQRWMAWLLLGLQGKSETSKAFHAVSPKEVGLLARRAVTTAIGNLYKWENSEEKEICARETVTLIQRIVADRQVSEARIRVNFSRAANVLATCACAKVTEGPRADFNLAFRSLIKLCETTSQADTWDLGGRVALKEVTGVLIYLSETNLDRTDLSSWVEIELHNLTDKLAMTPHIPLSLWTKYLCAVSMLRHGEITAILAGPEQTRSHDLRGAVNHRWAIPILEQMKARGQSSTLVPALAALGRRWQKDCDLEGLILITESLAAEYASMGDDPELRPMLIDATAFVRKAFKTLVLKNGTLLGARGGVEQPASERAIRRNLEQRANRLSE